MGDFLARIFDGLDDIEPWVWTVVGRVGQVAFFVSLFWLGLIVTRCP